jgi:hypothetical protein
MPLGRDGSGVRFERCDTGAMRPVQTVLLHLKPWGTGLAPLSRVKWNSQSAIAFSPGDFCLVAIEPRTQRRPTEMLERIAFHACGGVAEAVGKFDARPA